MWCSDLYETPPYEPEGLIGLFNAGLLHYLGTLHTYTVRDKQTGSRPVTDLTTMVVWMHVWTQGRSRAGRSSTGGPSDASPT